MARVCSFGAVKSGAGLHNEKLPVIGLGENWKEETTVCPSFKRAKRRATNFYGQTFNYPTFFLLELLLKCFAHPHTHIYRETGHMHMCG